MHQKRSFVIPRNIFSNFGNHIPWCLGPRAFAGCPNLHQITIPDSVTFIGHHAFYGCTKLVIPMLGAHVEVGHNAFKECMKPDIFFKSTPLKNEVHHDDVCSICLDSDWNDEAIKLNCGHIFHRTCAKTWYNQAQTCSNCRTQSTCCNNIIVIAPKKEKEKRANWFHRTDTILVQ